MKINFWIKQPIWINVLVHSNTRYFLGISNDSIDEPYKETDISVFFFNTLYFGVKKVMQTLKLGVRPHWLQGFCRPWTSFTFVEIRETGVSIEEV